MKRFFKSLAGVLLCAVTCQSQVIVGGGGSTMSAALTSGLNSNQFPNLARRITFGLPIRIGSLGDSVSYLTASEMTDEMAFYFGRSGASVNAGNWYGHVAGSATLVTNGVADTNWWGPYFDIANTGLIDSTNYFNSEGATGLMYANRAEVFYLGNVGSGGFNFSIRSNGGTFYATQSVQTASLSVTGRVATVALIPGYYQARVTCTNGWVKIIGTSLWSTNTPGVRPSWMAQAGLNISTTLNLASNYATLPILQAIAPDILFIESTADTVPSFGNALATWENSVGRYLTNTDVVYLGTPPIDSAYAFNYSAQNANMRDTAARYRRYYFDQTLVSGTFSNMQFRGLAGDGLHRTNMLDKMFASALFRAMGVQDYIGGGLYSLLGRTNVFSGKNTFADNVTLSGAASTMFFADRTLGGYFGKLTSDQGQFRFGALTPAANYDALMLDSAWGIFTPMSIGGAWGRAGMPFTMHGSNSVDWGVFTATNGVQVGSACRLLAGTGTPEGVVTAPVGSLFMRTDGGAGTSLYVKQTGAGNTGWIGK